MMERGAQVSDEDFEVVMDYLLRHYGRINVNKAEAEDLAIVVGVSKKDAEAIVQPSRMPRVTFRTSTRSPRSLESTSRS